METITKLHYIQRAEMAPDISDRLEVPGPETERPTLRLVEPDDGIAETGRRHTFIASVTDEAPFAPADGAFGFLGDAFRT